jgi:DNA-binding transcriptional LysR family regulator
MNWEDLRIFLAVANAGTISGAARHLSIDQATVSRRLATLELALGGRLIERLPREARFTALGKTVRVEVETMEERALAIARIALSATSDTHTRITLSAPPILARHLLAPHINTLSQRLARVQLTIFSESHFVSLAKVEADVALRLAPGDRDTDIVKKIGQMPFALYATADYPRRTDEANWEFVGYTERQTNFEHKEWLYRTIGARRVACEVMDLSNQYEAACSGIGVAGLPCYLADADPRLVRLVTRQPMLNLGIWLAIHPDRRNDVLVRRTMSAVTELIRDCGLA